MCRRRFTSHSAPRPVSVNYPDWQVKYIEALLENDPSKLKERVGVPESALLNRLYVMLQDPNASRERGKLRTQ